jgi:hypothetical protein
MNSNTLRRTPPSSTTAWKLLVPTLAALLMSLPVCAAKPVYRCVKDGLPVLSDQPCDGAATGDSATGSPTSAPPAGGAQSMPGEWRGQAQYQASESNQQIDAAHAVVALVLKFTADGKVSGSSPDNGCEWLGLWTAGATPRLFTLDISAAGCRFSGFNRRYTGSLSATWMEQSAQVGLQAFDLPHPGQSARMYDIRASLRR